MIKARRSYQGFIMWLCAATFYSFQFLIRVSPNVMTTELMSAFDIHAYTLGAVISCYYWGYSLMQIPAGVLLDTVGPRRPLTAACLLCLSGCIIFALGHSIYMLAFGRILMGIGSAFGFLTTVRIVSTWFNADKLGLFVGLTFMYGTLGAISGSGPLRLLLNVTNWQNCLFILAAISALLSILSWYVVRDNVPDQEEKNLLIQPKFSLSLMLISVLDILKKPQTWIFAAYGFLMYVPLSGFADLWSTSFMAQKFNVDQASASNGMIAFYIGASIGSPLWPIFASYIKSYKKTMIISAFLTTLFMYMALYGESFNFFQCCIILALAGACCAGQFLAFSGVADINSPAKAATASGIHNMLCMFSGNLMQPLLGHFLHKNWSTRQGVMLEGVPYYILEDFNFALIFIPISLIIAIFVAFFVRETYPKLKKN